ncbi:LacI family DNA-binding transcriptional regulator [Cerasicoccus maritimus]|uniref:LacI family DNA-binding transcriptional regulator n=1 Tax=Cerasicoccus maritimus TaxID=490089 RepID=UPI002852CB28|nr:LacI family DNA-binding transcriptional regulator [Cerasicoccus maritimus]
MNKPLVKREDVAQAAGVSTAAVSLALRGKVGVSAAKREHILAVAQRMGYQIDTVASMLASKRHRSHSEARNLEIAFLSENPLEDGIEEQVRTATQTNFRIVQINKHTNFRRLLRELYHQGVSGILLQWRNIDFNGEDPLALPWSDFSVAKVSRGNTALPFNLVRHSPFDFTMTTLVEVAKRGYRRMAMLCTESVNPWDDDARLGAIYSFQHRRRNEGIHCFWRVIQKQKSHPDLGATTIDWLRECRPDVVILPYTDLRKAYEQVGLHSQFPTYCSITTNSFCGIAGCDSQMSELYIAGARMVAEQIAHGEKGFPTYPKEIVMVPQWVEGKSLPIRTS